ncbi:cellulose binding domain-containing protein [Actinoplanes friuliensis]|uniref:Putative GDSL-like lipase/acylhydrolase with Cellulose binding domain n=1 Tax=Actinoplanes friuliensis DSM 7358 TaxID=1246995 RepID=U5VZI7_9ACTN|nr:cellulose binding domain-containing protein [Actinoplanes friuliensis]AGZ42187.1 putative GDSL-like lipase/acylhydrolase with Cellulose binding domain [Actinoplanes friuliensis DSM 7358]
MSGKKLLACMAVAALVPIGLFAAPASAAAGCSVAYTVTNQWQGGFGASVAITNLGDPVAGWTLAFSFPSGQTVTQLWNGVVTQSGSAVSVKDAGYNGSIGTNASTSFGFNGAWSGSNTVPSSFTLNGVTCTGGVTTPPTTPPPSTPPPTTPPPTTPPPTTPPPTTPPPGAAVKVMALGDSITGSPGCWRALLWRQLQQGGYTGVDFVGTLPGQGCGFTYDGENEGHGGFLATNVADQNQLPGWLAATDPDVVMMHFGTNDVWSNRSPATILAAFTKLVGQMRASNPAMKILVAQILPMTPSNCADCNQRVLALNAAIPAWAASTSTAASPVTVVDQYTGFNTAIDTPDGVHPNDAGNVKIANRWYPALTAALS